MRWYNAGQKVNSARGQSLFSSREHTRAATRHSQDQAQRNWWLWRAGFCERKSDTFQGGKRLYHSIELPSASERGHPARDSMGSCAGGSSPENTRISDLLQRHISREVREWRLRHSAHVEQRFGPTSANEDAADDP